MGGEPGVDVEESSQGLVSAVGCLKLGTLTDEGTLEIRAVAI